jgi:hypothetical protein
MNKSKKGQLVLQKVPEGARKKGFMDRIMEAQKNPGQPQSRKKKK